MNNSHKINYVNWTCQAVHGNTLELALTESGCDRKADMPCLLSDNGSSYMVEELAGFLTSKGMKHVRGRPYGNPP